MTTYRYKLYGTGNIPHLISREEALREIDGESVAVREARLRDHEERAKKLGSASSWRNFQLWVEAVDD